MCCYMSLTTQQSLSHNKRAKMYSYITYQSSIKQTYYENYYTHLSYYVKHNDGLCLTTVGWRTVVRKWYGNFNPACCVCERVLYAYIRYIIIDFSPFLYWNITFASWKRTFIWSGVMWPCAHALRWVNTVSSSEKRFYLNYQYFLQQWSHGLLVFVFQHFKEKIKLNKH